ncbi:hypothetical protein [Flavilitoribacter nigricans]|uniref:Thioredoxin domain-containing protein n=1 Tax=Flavilitoribacter nigricans (strain ATCC 23147 / DSM 23189 / NBRC 102662 / NCIMB 1420 / SS-2) TaxID=1122177 RepID=A0A2D0N3L1_FLAN2|nr:hypothetical protein [Flavilitoribacter nigricans]PHN02980.1 hypothetical protein CRP01_29695 [Flavilitoribacter nigricans DSM 23189 = NBRC 102662]
MYRYRLVFPLLLCLYFSGLSGQVLVTGKINHSVDTLVALIIPPTTLGGAPSTTSVRLSAGNEFSFAIDTNVATSAQLTHGESNIFVFLVPNQSFSLEFIGGEKEAKAVRFAGPGGADNTFFHAYLQFLAEQAPPIDSSRLARSTTREYRRLMEQNRAARENFVENYTSKTGIKVAPQLLQWLRNDIAYTYATALLRYPSDFQRLHAGTKHRDPSASYFSFLDHIAVNNPDAILQASYQRFLESFIIHKLKKPMDWELRTGGAYQYAFLNRFLIGPSLYYMQYLVFERNLNWLVKPEYMAKQYQAFMASDAPVLLKQKLKDLRESPPKVYSLQSFSIVDGPVLAEVFQFHNGDRPDTSFFQGRPSLLYFHDRRFYRVDFVIHYLKKLRQNLIAHPDMNICLVDMNGDFADWQKFYSENEYDNHPITHLSMNYFDKAFDMKLQQGRHPNIVLIDTNGLIVEALNWKPPVKRILELIEQIP